MESRPSFFLRRCIDCQCLDPTYSVRSEYPYHADFVDDYITNETFVDFLAMHAFLSGLP